MEKMKQTRTRYSQEYKDDALALAAKLGFSQAADQLGHQVGQLHAWKSQKRQKQTGREREEALELELVKLKRQLADQAEELAIIKKAAAYFARGQK